MTEGIAIHEIGTGEVLGQGIAADSHGHDSKGVSEYLVHKKTICIGELMNEDNITGGISWHHK